MDKEQEIRLHFLDEAMDYLTQIESGVLGLSDPSKNNLKLFDSVLRAAHSTKGGAAMMGYHQLSDLAHRLEDSFKVIKATQAKKVTPEAEHLLLQSIDLLRQSISFYRQGINPLDENWFVTKVNPLFEQLYLHFGDFKQENSTPLDVEKVEMDVITLLFQTEVEGCLERLENVLESAEKTCLKEEFSLAAQELGGLGEMLGLKGFSPLCQEIEQKLATCEDDDLTAIAQAALTTWRRSQALILVGKIDNLPTSEQFESELEQSSLDFAEQDLYLSLDMEEFESEDLSFLTLTKTEATSTDSEPITLISEDSENTIRVAVRHLEQLSDLVGELTIERNGLNLQLAALRGLINLLNQRVKTLYKSNSNLRTLYDQGIETVLQDWSKDGEILISENRRENDLLKSNNYPLGLFLAPSPNNSFFDQLELDRYSDIHLIFQSLMETIVQIQEVTEDINIKLEDTQGTSRHLTQTSQLLQNQVTQVRMRPFSDLVRYFPRSVREMSLKYNKQVKLEITGGSTLLDRTILEALSDPLLHLLRNAFDHGIEDPYVRITKGKPLEGTIKISAVHRGNQTILTVADDGGGIDLNKIKARALDMGLDWQDLEEASKNELLDLIFEQGFTTAENITDLSGRGVGLNIVRTQVQQIRGQIQVDTEPGKGTAFIITVPFTLSVVRVLLVESGGLMLAFPSSVVEEMLIPDPSIILTSAGQEYLNWDGFMIPLIRLQQWLKFSRFHRKPETDAFPTINQPVVLIIAQGTELFGLEVESYWGEQEVTIRALEGPLKLPSGFSGCTILGDGRVVPLVETTALLRTIDQHRSNLSSRKIKLNLETLQTSLETSILPHSQGEEKVMVMVVDDSINVRRFLALTLEKAGYRVQQAKDGQEALDKLREGLPIQAVVCDIEMPRLDGYGFLAHVKAEPAFKSIPVIMLTSRSSNKHRQMAMNLGASAYFSKPFQEPELLQTIRSLVKNDLVLANYVH